MDEVEKRQFLESIFRKDQRDQRRNNARACYEELIDKQKEFVGTVLEDEYWNEVSLEAFHMTQDEAMQGKTDRAIKNATIALEAARKGISKEWEAYVLGTLFYLQGDVAKLESLLVKDCDNKPVLKRLLAGCKKRGQINYREDYGSTLSGGS